jgi:hypothetical protein
LQVQYAPGYDDNVFAGNIQIAEVRGEEKVVRADGGAEQQSPSVPQVEPKLGKMPGALKE